MMRQWLSIPLTNMLSVPFLLLITLYSVSGNNSSSKSRDKTSPYGSCGQHACFCAPGFPGIPGSPGPAGPAGAAGAPGNHGPEGSMGPRGNKGDEGPRGSQGPQGSKGAQGKAGALGSQGPPGPVGRPGNKGDAGARGRQGPQGPKGAQGKAGARGSQGQAGRPGNKGDTGARGRRGLQGPRGAPGSFQGRNWKQCVFKNINDGRDSGLVKECVFKKKSGNTGLRVFWNGVLRIYGCDNCCRRWYFTFNGAECSAPAAIEGVVYMINGHRTKKNLHRVRQIEGVCEKVHKGTVRVGFWVGNCAGYGSADAHTGWNSVSRIYVEEVPPPQA